MGEVLLAEDTRLDRAVALKVLPREVANNASRRQRFLFEAKAAAAINHPNVCTIFEVGEAADSRPFIAMEYLEGHALDALARRRRLELRELVALGVQVAAALEAARQHEVVHRDIKPGNIFFVSTPNPEHRNSNWQVKVLDFGLAKRLDPSAEAPTLTQEGSILGTPNYLSPELALGREVDNRTDIFSLGVVLYELAAGRNPFAGKSFGDTVNNILNREPEPLRPWNPSVTSEFERVVRKCLEKDRIKRYATPGQLQDDLARLQATLQAPRFPNRRVTAVAASALALGIVWLAGAWWMRPRPAAHVAATTAQKSVAVLPFVNMSADKADEYLGDGISEEIIAALSKIKGLKVPARTSCFAFKGKSENIRAIGQELDVNTVLEGSISKAGNKVRVTAQLINIADGFHVWSETYDRGLNDLLAIRTEVAARVAEALRGQLLGEERRQLAGRGTIDPEAYRLYLNGRYLWNRRTPEDLKQAMEYFNQAIAHDPAYALAYSGLADCYNVLPFNTGMPRRDALPRSRAAARKALELDSTLAEPHVTLADAQADLDWDWSGAEQEFRRALALNPNYATAHQWFAQMLEALGRNEEALAEITQAQEIDPLSRPINTVLARILGACGKTDLAVELLRKQIAFDPAFVIAHEYLGRIYYQQGKLSEAIAEIQTMHQLDKSGIYGLNSLGCAYALAGNTNEALKVLAQMQDLQQQGLDYRVAIAGLQHALGDNDGALDSLDKGVAERAFGLEALYADPDWKDLCPHPRVQAILKKMNLMK
jgi:serine/threonine-protein kinase